MAKQKWQSVKHLLDALKQSDSCWYSRSQMLRLEKEGKLTLPKKVRGDKRIVTQRMIDEIAVEFSPGGSGQWHYKKTSTN